MLTYKQALVLLGLVVIYYVVRMYSKRWYVWYKGAIYQFEEQEPTRKGNTPMPSSVHCYSYWTKGEAKKKAEQLMKEKGWKAEDVSVEKHN